MNQAAGGFDGRATFIDALRGIAALGVACYHIARYELAPQPSRQFIPEIFQTVCDYGWRCWGRRRGRR